MKWNSNQVLSWFSGFHVHLSSPNSFFLLKALQYLVDWVFFKLHIAVCTLRESFFLMVQF